MASFATTATTTVSWCTTCRARSTFEQPDCPDEHGHGVDCPEWACVVCGEAVVVAFGLADPGVRFDLTSHVA
jgi:hypothetical protein